MENKKIEAYSLFEFCQQVQSAIAEGYSFDFDSNENFPTAFGSLLVAGMVKVQTKVKTEVLTEVETKVDTEQDTEISPAVATRGRPKAK